MMSRLYISDLATALWWQLSDDGSDWLKTALHQLSPEQSPERLSGKGNSETLMDAHLRFSAQARRELGAKVLVDLPGRCQWHTDEAGRLLLLAQLLESSLEQSLEPVKSSAELVKAAFKCGDENEKMAIIKGLYLIDPEGQLIDLNIATGRTNSVDLFAAIALNNPYPAQHYDHRAFNQLVLKSLFMDLDIVNIIGLKSRLSHKLSSLAIDMVNERLAANRMPPASIWLAINFADLEKTDQDTYLKFVSDDNPLQRYYCLLGLHRCLGEAQNIEFEPQIKQRLAQLLAQQGQAESEERIKTLIGVLLLE